MGRSPCCSKEGLNKGAWTEMENKTLMDYIEAHGEGQWANLAKKAGLKRCGKSCRLRWLNYLRPDIKRGNITPDEEELIVKLHKLLGSRWSLIAGRLPGRTDNEIKNYWNTNLGKKLQKNPTNSSQHRHQNLQLHSSSNTEKNRTPSLDQLNIPKPSSENVISPEPYPLRPKDSKFSKVDIQETAYMLTDQIGEKHQEGPVVVENNETMLPVVPGQPSENPLEFMADFEMDENSLADFVDCEFLKLCDFDCYNGGEEHKSFPSDPGTYVISDTENDQVQQDSDFQRQMSLLLASEMEWV